MNLLFRLSFLFMASLLLSGSLRAAQAQSATLSLNHSLPGDDLVGAAAGAQLSPAVARGGAMQLAVWSDWRAMPSGVGYEYETSSDIYGLRLDAAGNPLDAVPFVITQAPATQENPQVSWNGLHWLVVFESYDISGTGYYYQKSLSAVRVAPSGQVLDPQPIKIFNVVPGPTMWAVTSDGADWMLAFQTSGSSNDLHAMRITAAGVVQQPPQSLVPETYYQRYNLRLAYVGGVYLLTWDDNGSGKALRFDASITPLDAAPLTLVAGATITGLAASGSQFYIVWQEQQPDFTLAVKGSRVSTAGVKLDGNGVIISGNNSSQFTANALAWDGTNWRVIWSVSAAGQVRIASINAAGQVLNPGGALLNGPVIGSMTSAPNGGVQLVWSSYTVNQNDVLTARVSAGNVAGPTVMLSTGSPMQIRADVATGSNGYMVVYRSDIAGFNRILAQPLDAAGNPLTAAPILLDTGDNLYGPAAPSVAWNGSLYLASWSNSSGIVAQRLLPDGTKVDPTPFFVMVGFDRTGVAALGDLFLIIGRQYGFHPHYVFPVAARVRGSDGVVLDPTPLMLGNSYVHSVSVTTLGSRWLAVWHSTGTHDNPIGSTMGAFVNGDGSALPEFSIYGSYSMSGGNGIFEIDVAAGVGSALVLQSAEISSGVETDLVARLVNADGSMQSPLTLTPWIGNQYRPRVAWDGSQFLVVYNEQKNRFAPWTLDQLDATSDLFGMRISAAGTIIDPQGFAFSMSATADAFPTVTAGSGVTLIAASIMQNGAPYAAYRIRYDLFGDDGNQWPVAAATASASGGDVPLMVSFSAAGSGDPDGAITSYAWDFGDGGSSTQANPNHAYTTPGNYVATLTVTDDQGAVSVNSVPVAATAPNMLPVAVASAAPTAGPAPLNVIFYAAGSYDPDGAIGNIEWTFSDGGSYWGSPAYHTFSAPGVYQATVTVYDNRGGTGSDSVTIYVGQPNQPPVAVIDANPASGDAPLTVNFSSAASYDPDGNIAAYHWDFGDGQTSTEANPTHIYPDNGTFVAILTVTDNQGATASDNVPITVNSDVCTLNCLRAANIYLTGRDVGSGVRISGLVFVRSETGAKVFNAIVTATWTRPNGTQVTQAVYTNEQGRAPFGITGGHGAYTLTVNDITLFGWTFDPANSVLERSITQ